MNVNIQSAINPTLINAIANVRDQIHFDVDTQEFTLVEDGSAASYDLLERMLTEELENTELDYNVIGESEFQRIFDMGFKALDGSNPLVENALRRMEGEELEEEILAEADEVYEEEIEEEEDEEEVEEESDEDAVDVLFDFMNEIIEEVKLNPDTDEDYLEVRFRNGLKTRSIEVTLND